MQLTGQQQYYSIGNVLFQMELNGGYGDLQHEVLDKFLAAAHTGIAQLPMWVDGRTDEQSMYVTDGGRYSAETADDDGTIRITLSFDGVSKNTVPEALAKATAKAIIRSCITEALVDSIGAQALNDTFARAHGSRLTTVASEELSSSRSGRTRQLR
jgi:hypothetical protein